MGKTGAEKEEKAIVVTGVSFSKEPADPSAPKIIEWLLSRWLVRAYLRKYQQNATRENLKESSDVTI
ncbi:MAG: hypothetical protein ACYS8Z_00360 [Planctomycetota bacterium]